MEIREQWERVKFWLNSVPDCPACGGSGLPTGRYANWGEAVYFLGKEYVVCHNCMGSGKV